MSTIPISLTEKQFEEHVGPFLSKAKRGFVCKVALYKVFNYILYRLYTGCQWDQIAIAPDPRDAKKKKSVAMRCTITTVNGHAMAA
jgi:transposase